jgi:hypothetical protein
MQTNYADKLERLRQRRAGDQTDVGLRFAESSALLKSTQQKEKYQTRTASSALQYALGCMQEVDPTYTKNSYAEGVRVRNQVDRWMRDCGIRASFEYLGSLPLNIHIRGVSDVDLLVMHEEFVTLDWSGPRAASYKVLGLDVLTDMLRLRSECEDVLESRFPEAKVEKNKGKSIRISKGSLRRDIDVVPAHWHDTAIYQASGLKHDREIRILDKSVPVTLGNRPFMHMKKIGDKDTLSSGGLKKAIRLLKSLRNDADPKIDLSSYDIASLAWHFDMAGLRFPDYLDTVLLASIQVQLHGLLSDTAKLIRLDVPDGSRKIIDTPEKLGALEKLAEELRLLVIDIAASLSPRPMTRDPWSSAKFLAETQTAV